MIDQIPQDKIDYYRDNGFVVFDDFLDDAELTEWREAVDEAVQERSNIRIPGMADTHEDEVLAKMEPAQREAKLYYDKVFKQRLNLWQTNERVRKLMLDPRLGKVATELAGIDGIRIWHDQALIKEPYANPTGFHLDVPYWSFSNADALSVWVALDDATLENGCLYYIPGTHKAKKFDNVGIGREIDAIFSVYPEWKDVRPVACPVRAGGALFHNGLVAHGAGANMTPGYRRAMTCGYMPDGSTFNGTRNILSQEKFERLTIGDLMEDDEQNPLIYSKSKPLVTA